MCTFSNVTGNHPIPFWIGQLDSKPVEFTISDKPVADLPGPIVVTETDDGKTVKVKVGQAIDVRLKSDKKLQGWESEIVRGVSPVFARGDQPRFNPAPNFVLPANGDDESIGTYRFGYAAATEGTAVLSFRLQSPSGPTVTARDSTALIRTISVTIEVEK